MASRRSLSIATAAIVAMSLSHCRDGGGAAEAIGMAPSSAEERAVPVSDQIMALVGTLEPTAADQARLLSDGVVTRSEVDVAMRRTIECGEAAAGELGLEVVFREYVDEAGLPTYSVEAETPSTKTADEADLLLAAWDIAHQRCEANEKALVKAAFTGASPFDDRGVNQLEVALVDAGAIDGP